MVATNKWFPFVKGIVIWSGKSHLNILKSHVYIIAYQNFNLCSFSRFGRKRIVHDFECLFNRFVIFVPSHDFRRFWAQKIRRLTGFPSSGHLPMYDVIFVVFDSFLRKCSLIFFHKNSYNFYSVRKWQNVICAQCRAQNSLPDCQKNMQKMQIWQS